MKKIIEELTEEWRLQAACRGVGPELFFHAKTPDNGYDDARALCARCPVRINCLDYALRREPIVQGHRIGVWGGLLPGERKRLAAKIGRLHVCAVCGEAFTHRSNLTKVCSPECRRILTNRHYRERYTAEVEVASEMAG